MIALQKPGPFHIVLPLLRTLLDIVLLRKGPEAIPRSNILFAMIVGFWLLSSLAVLSLIEQYDEQDFIIGLFTALIGLVCYAVTVVMAGFPARVLQTLSAVLGCGAVISFVFVAEFVLFTPFLGQTITGIVAQLILLLTAPSGQLKKNMQTAPISRFTFFFGVDNKRSCFCQGSLYL